MSRKSNDNTPKSASFIYSITRHINLGLGTLRTPSWEHQTSTALL